MTIELRHLRSFLAVAERGSFTAAAGAMFMSQSGLSRTLQQLEDHLGVRLVERTTHHCALTDAGERFRPFAVETLRALEAGVAAVTAPTAPLCLGASWSTSVYAAAIVRAWAKGASRPILVRRSDDHLAGLMSAAVDIALVWGSVTDAGIMTAVLGYEPRVVALAATHPLARRRTLTLTDLAKGSVVVNTTTGTTTLELWPEARRPTVAADTVTIDDWLVAIATTRAFGVSAESTSRLHPHPDVRYIPIRDAPLLPLVVAWRRGHPEPDRRRFLAIASRVGAQLLPPGGLSASFLRQSAK